ncbi:hypothetical protein ABW636_02695 [Aquimarina sp. 2201CG1-2-11]|uniref:hypothetical protein n=1 Tax=Aquimarina discodermiae TaxID=3231043 RepID=UPI0034623F23
MAVGIFGEKAGVDQFLIQGLGILIIGSFCIITSFIIVFFLKKTIGIRVSEKEEIDGLDSHEHGMDAYPDFRINQH